MTIGVGRVGDQRIVPAVAGQTSVFSRIRADRDVGVGPDESRP